MWYSQLSSTKQAKIRLPSPTGWEPSPVVPYWISFPPETSWMSWGDRRRSLRRRSWTSTSSTTPHLHAGKMVASSGFTLWTPGHNLYVVVFFLFFFKGISHSTVILHSVIIFLGISLWDTDTWRLLIRGVSVQGQLFAVPPWSRKAVQCSRTRWQRWKLCRDGTCEPSGYEMVSLTTSSPLCHP